MTQLDRVFRAVVEAGDWTPVSSLAVGLPRRSTMRCLRTLEKSGCVELNTSQPRVVKALRKIRVAPDANTRAGQVVRFLSGVGGGAVFGDILRSFQGFITPNNLSVVLAAAIQSGRILKSGERRHYWYSLPSGEPVDRSRMVSSVFNLGDRL